MAERIERAVVHVKDVTFKGDCGAGAVILHNVTAETFDDAGSIFRVNGGNGESITVENAAIVPWHIWLKYSRRQAMVFRVKKFFFGWAWKLNRWRKEAAERGWKRRASYSMLLHERDRLRAEVKRLRKGENNDARTRI